MEINNYNKIAIIGIGGGANYYIARFFLNLGVEIQGFDINKSEKTTELEKLGAKITYTNPEGDLGAYDLVIYSSSLPKILFEKIENQTKQEKKIEVGELTKGIIEKYERNKLTENEKAAFRKSELAPLFTLDTSSVKIIGVTGTDGKTTTSSMIYQILLSANKKVGLITTVSAKIGEKEIDTGLHTTTPSNQELYRILKEMIDEKCEYIVLETSSHGLAMGRVAGLKYDVAAITNISNEHLDYHKTFKEYIYAKSLLFSKYLVEDGTAVLNFDDKKSFDYLKNKVTNIVAYSKNPTEKFLREYKNVLYAKNTNVEINEITYKLNNEYEITLNITGEYNVSNSLAAIGATKACGIDFKDIKKGLAEFTTPKGRMNVLQESPFKVIVDFAHTPNALKNALETVNKIKQEEAKVIVVFGCAGNRDTSKRAPMGKIARELADITIITAEDPRTESLEEINNEIERGWISIKTRICNQHKDPNNKSQLMETKDAKTLIRYDDDQNNVQVRRKAISRALREAHHKDIVIITGKGHENSLCFGTTEYNWNDIEETNKLLK